MRFQARFLAVTLAFLVALPMVGCSLPGTGGTTSLQASGMIEATEIAIAPELPGRVVDVAVDEGKSVAVGDVLLHLDDSLLQVQRQAASAALATAQAGVAAAQAGLDSAQAAYDLALAAALEAEPGGDLAFWEQAGPGDFVLPSWYYSKAEQLQSTQAAVDAARTALESAQTDLREVADRVGNAGFLDADRRLSDARVAFQIAQDLLDQARAAADNPELLAHAQSIADDAGTELEDAQSAYDEALTTTGALDVLSARARVAVEQQRYDDARAALRALQTGADSLAVAAAARTVDQARAVLEQAQAAVAQAEAEVQLLDAQIDKATVRAPVDGVVLVRSVEPGEVVQAGMTILTLGQLDRLRVTVYIPEDRYGEIKLGDTATLSVDSFPGESFSATVTRISDQAEFTPRNVQTQEQRQTTVYAVELAIASSDGRLKPGMPVDVRFGK
jgi:HlyD family secretion protein